MATSLAVLLILESLLESGKVELTSEMKRDPAQWNCKCRNARQHGEEREEGGGDLKKKKKTANMVLALIRDSHSFGDIFPKLKLEGKSHGYYATLPRILSRGQMNVSPEPPINCNCWHSRRSRGTCFHQMLVFNISHSVSKLEFVHCYQLGTDAPERTYLKVGGLLWTT